MKMRGERDREREGESRGGGERESGGEGGGVAMYNVSGLNYVDYCMCAEFWVGT
jgi:hypothetical protein